MLNIVEEYYTSGQLERRYEARGGKRHGKFTKWFPNGRIRSRKFYKDGKRHGVQLEWLPDGSRSHLWTWDHSKRHGVFKAWLSRDIISYEMYYWKDRLVSKRTFNNLTYRKIDLTLRLNYILNM